MKAETSRLFSRWTLVSLFLHWFSVTRNFGDGTNWHSSFYRPDALLIT